MQFRLLGALEAGSGGTVVELGSPKQRALLAILLLHAGEIVPVDRLIDLLWGDGAPRTAAHSVQIYVSELRKALEPLGGGRLIHTQGPGYRLDTPPEAVDAKWFETLVQRGTAELETGNREHAMATLQSALELWRGPALSDFAYEEFAQPYVRRLNDLHLDAIEALAAAALDAGQTGQVVPLLEAAVREDPLRERSRELLMLALYRCGRHAEALRTYEVLRHTLGDELGLDPSPSIQALRDRVLLHDPALLPAAQREPAPRARNPFKGLQAFGEADTHDYFGREALVDRLVQLLAGGRRLIALVGPSGSGKSSVVAAGLIPRLRAGDVPGSERWRIAFESLGPEPMGEVRAAIGRVTGTAGPGRGSLGQPSAADGGARVVLVIDHFEQLFTIAEESRRNQFLAALAAELDDPEGRLVVILTLRADYYDRPLQHPAFGEVFVPAVVPVLPMSARELEAAIVEPAEQVGVAIETGLVGELVAESVARPGSLPLLQYALTELFEQRTGAVLTLAGYAALGGVRGVLSRRAETVFLGLDADEQRIATQVFLRLVRLGRGVADSRQRLRLAELTDLGIDAVALSTVLTSFGRHRLLTFDHDPGTGEATVELAHEALLTEWERLAGWIDRHRVALRRRDSLVSAVDEWELSGRDPDYLLTGGRLAEFEAWALDGSLQLTRRERAFLEAGVDHRRAQEADVAAHRRLARSARVRLLALVAALVALVGAAAGFAVLAARPAPPAPVTFAWSDDSNIVTALAVSGFDRAVSDFGLAGKKVSMGDIGASLEATYGADTLASMPPDQLFPLFRQEQLDELARLSEDGTGLIVTWGGPPAGLDSVATHHPQTRYANADGTPGLASNVAYLAFDNSQPAYLAGAAAALKSRTGIIGYIGGVDWEGIWGFQAGYEAGARAVNPNVRILVEYLSASDDFSGFQDTNHARQVGLRMFGAGADVVMHAAGTSGLGLFDAATEMSQDGRLVWAIGVDSDQYQTVLGLRGQTNASRWQPHILTSALKPLEGMVYQVVADYARGTLRTGRWTWGLASDQSGISFSGGFIEDIRPTIQDLQAQIIAGEIVVPCLPADKVEAAAKLGIDPDYCRK